MYGVICLSDQLNLTIRSSVIGLISVITSAAILTGFLTRIFSAAVVLGAAVMMSQLLLFNQDLSGDHFPGGYVAVYVIVIAISLALSGPGAFSLDARWFGRREIIIPDD